MTVHEMYVIEAVNNSSSKENREESNCKKVGLIV
jgi:hypothetical protein